MTASNNRIKQTAGQAKLPPQGPSNLYRHGDVVAKLHTFDYDMYSVNALKRGGPILKVHAIAFQGARIRGRADDNQEIVKVEYQGMDITQVVLAHNELYQEVEECGCKLLHLAFNTLYPSDASGFKVERHEWDHQWRAGFGDGIEHAIKVRLTVHEGSLSGVYCSFPEFHEITVDGSSVNEEEIAGILFGAFYSNERVTPQDLEYVSASEWRIIRDRLFLQPASNVKPIGVPLAAAA